MEDLERILHQYLVEDLVDLKKSRVGYPILMTVFAGVELLGALLTEGQHGTDRDDFVHYWTKYLYPPSKRPKTDEEAEIIYNGVRHGVMHHFFPKGQVGITGTDPGAHMTCRDDGVLILDTKVLVDDFVGAYEKHVVKILNTPTGIPSRELMQKRLDDIRAAGRKKMGNLYAVFPGALAATSQVAESKAISSASAVGVSGPTGPV
ncbi:MAG: hypothetical protein U9Q74_05640 [Gemmatimonadota bacterium]|nr:hypothetical protein [Gemmatimonadota bacterium]